jgi:hypothetical protein
MALVSRIRLFFIGRNPARVGPIVRRVHHDDFNLPVWLNDSRIPSDHADSRMICDVVAKVLEKPRLPLDGGDCDVRQSMCERERNDAGPRAKVDDA